MEGDSPSKVPKTVLMKGQINIYEFRLTKKMADAIEANGGTTDNIRVIDHDDRVDVIAEGKLFAFGNTVWMAGDGNIHPNPNPSYYSFDLDFKP